MEKTRPPCVYCGVNEGVTDDHVIPKCLFVPPLPNNMVVVPACRPCNEEKGGDDTYLRDMLVVDWENDPHPLAQGDLKGKVIRAIGRNRSHLVRDGRQTRRPTPVTTPAGLYLGTAPAIPMDPARIDRIFGRIVRGLYYRLYAENRLPIDTAFEVGKVHPMKKQELLEFLGRKGGMGYHSLGDPFDCAFNIAKDEPSVSYWLLRFMNVFVLVFTNAAKPRQPPKLLT